MLRQIPTPRSALGARISGYRQPFLASHEVTEENVKCSQAGLPQYAGYVRAMCLPEPGAFWLPVHQPIVDATASTLLLPGSLTGASHNATGSEGSYGHFGTVRHFGPVRHFGTFALVKMRFSDPGQGGPS
jgi:hypothetical protein